jgi:hypothetical protein
MRVVLNTVLYDVVGYWLSTCDHYVATCVYVQVGKASNRLRAFRQHVR